MLGYITKKPTRPAVRYFGGKWNIAPWVISFFPPHQSYIEACGGGASVLLKKERSPLETYNDIDGNVVNFFRVLREQPEELIRRLELTPYAREEYRTGFQPTDDPLERARRFYVVCAMSIIPVVNANFRPNLRSCRFVARAEQSNSLGFLHPRNFDHLYQVAERFLGVQIENDDFAAVVKTYDNPDALIYVDPPYTDEQRTARGVYLHEWTEEQHAAAADLLRRCRGKVIISGYACSLYADLYERHGWQRHDRQARQNMGGESVESVWLSPVTVAALARPKQSLLFAEVA